MGTLNVTVGVNVTGPLADGTASEVVHAWLDDTKAELGQRAVDALRQVEMDKTGRATGHYQSQLQTVTLQPYNDVLVKDPVVYGPWLEGTSRRNASTRFKGYRLWRQTKRRLNEEAVDVAEEKWPKYRAQLGGGE